MGWVLAMDLRERGVATTDGEQPCQAVVRYWVSAASVIRWRQLTPRTGEVSLGRQLGAPGGADRSIPKLNLQANRHEPGPAIGRKP